MSATDPSPHRTPPKEADRPWVWARREKSGYPEPVRSGKWLCFCGMDYLDEVWAKISRATEEGLLGGASKASTTFRSPRGRSSRAVICVYTYDWEDEPDVMRVREELRTLGWNRTLSYKTDEDTLAGVYSDMTSDIAKHAASGIAKYTA